MHALVVLTLRTGGESHHELAREPQQTKRHPNPCPGPNSALTLALTHPTFPVSKVHSIASCARFEHALRDEEIVRFLK